MPAGEWREHPQTTGGRGLTPRSFSIRRHCSLGRRAVKDAGEYEESKNHLLDLLNDGVGQDFLFKTSSSVSRPLRRSTSGHLLCRLLEK